MNNPLVTAAIGSDREMLLNMIGSALTVGVSVYNLNNELLYKNDIFRDWTPKLHVDKRLWLEQMLPLLNKEQYNLYKDVSHSWIFSHALGKDIEIEVGYHGTSIFFLLKYSPLLNDDKDIVGLIETVDNVTDKKELDKSLNHARKFETVGRLASGIAHDFNNILQVINGHSEILIESRKSDEKLVRSLEIIFSAGQKASALTRQLLLFSRRQQGEFKSLNLGEMVCNMQKILTRMLGEDINMSLRINDQGLHISGDETQIEQIIMNLAVNARDAMPSGGKINIDIERCSVTEDDKSLYNYIKEGQYILMKFTDSGCGIPEHVLEHIFEPFYTTKEEGKGTGLGLATAYHIVKNHQGYIIVDSRINIGTCFRLYFPLSQEEKCIDVAEHEFKTEQNAEISVLILEDDANVSEFTSQVLSQYGYNVTCVSSVKQANEVVSNATFDLFLIDIVLPDGDGVAFLESLNANNANAAFVLSSGYTEDKPQIQSTISKGYSFLHKPFTIVSLLQACSTALQKKQSC